MRVGHANMGAFLSNHDKVVRVGIASVQGSTPRDVDAVMLVASDALWGTIGGGQLEYLAIDAARQMLRAGEYGKQLDVPLGPEIGQCCGGRVVLDFTAVDEAMRQALEQANQVRHAAQPHVYVFGAGHVGRALAAALSPLPVICHMVDEREAELVHCDQSAIKHLSALPEQIVRQAPAGSAFIIVTHDHALDFLIAHQALLRRDAAYVGMIGSRTKRIRFTSWLETQGEPSNLADRLVCPIGLAQKSSNSKKTRKIVQDKRPEVIAALVAAEILVHTAGASAEPAMEPIKQNSVDQEAGKQGRRKREFGAV